MCPICKCVFGYDDIWRCSVLISKSKEDILHDLPIWRVFMCLRWYAEIIWFYHDKNMYYIVSRVILGAEFKYAIRFDLSSKLRDFEKWGHCIKHDYRRPILSSRCDVINDIINIKKYFSQTFCDGLFISDVKINLKWKIGNF